MKFERDKDGLEMAMPDGNKTPKVDPSVLVTDLYLKGPMNGEVPLDVTIGKPRAYYPPTSGPK